MEEKHYETLYQTEKYHWWYAVRRRIIRDLISTHFPDKKRIKILDIGCGTGELLNELSESTEVFGIDISPQAIAFCKKRGLSRVAVAGATEIPFPNKTFDAILCLDVLEHVKDDEAALREIERVAKPGGTVVIFVPAFMFLWGKSDDISHHLRRYRLEGISQKVKWGGLNVVRSSYFNFFLFLPILTIRWLARILRIPIRNENETGKGLVNWVLFKIFSFEARLLRKIDFPFGVSGLIVSKKPN